MSVKKENEDSCCFRQYLCYEHELTNFDVVCVFIWDWSTKWTYRWNAKRMKWINCHNTQTAKVWESENENGRERDERVYVWKIVCRCRFGVVEVYVVYVWHMKKICSTQTKYRIAAACVLAILKTHQYSWRAAHQLSCLYTYPHPTFNPIDWR